MIWRELGSQSSIKISDHQLCSWSHCRSVTLFSVMKMILFLLGWIYWLWWVLMPMYHVGHTSVNPWGLNSSSNTRSISVIALPSPR